MFDFIKIYPVFDRVLSLFVGENSHKRTMGLTYLLIISFVYLTTGYIDEGLYKNLMGFGVLWLGGAYSAKITKLAKAMQNMKENK